MQNKFSYLNYFRPNLSLKTISQINVTMLKRSGVKYVICDLDNTLVPHFTKLPNNRCIHFFKSLHDNGIKVFIVSNNSKRRVERFCNMIDVDDFIYKAKKPFIYKINKLIKKYNIFLEDVLVIGDQFITDILMANRCGFKSILVLPLVDSVENNFQNFIIAILDKWIYKYIAHANIVNDEDFRGLKGNYDVI